MSSARMPVQVEDIERDDDELLADEVQLVTFKVDKEEYGVAIMQVQEIIRLGAIVRVPGAPHFVEGIMDLRGKVLPVVDLRRRFQLPPREHTASSRIVVVNIGDMTIGLIVDAVTEVLRLPTGAIEPPPRIVAGIDARFLKGIGRLDKRLLILLDLDRIFAEDEMASIEQITTEPEQDH
jgi:purine-binding chemotaxis protein CheW